MGSASEKGHTEQEYLGSGIKCFVCGVVCAHGHIGQHISLTHGRRDFTVVPLNALSGLDPSAIPDVVEKCERALELRRQFDALSPFHATLDPFAVKRAEDEARAALGKLRKGEG